MVGKKQASGKKLSVDERMALIKQVADGGELIGEEELRAMLASGKPLVAYDGFEPSGLAHIPFGLLRAENLKLMQQAGIHFKLWLADYFAFINNKLGGDMQRIRKAGDYFIEVWKACGVDTSKVEIIWASERMGSLTYWDRVLRIGKETTLNRTLRATTIMGRKEGDLQTTAQLFYPAMQVSDVFELDVDICQLGLDQRRANILARELADKLKWKKPVVVSHHMIMGLQGVQPGADKEDIIIASKMSKSKPESCIYMHDTLADITTKINKAYCPEKIIEGNPLFDYLKYLIMKRHSTIVIKRPAKFGGDWKGTYDELVALYQAGKLHPMDLKATVIRYMDEMIAPIRDYFQKNKKAKALYEEVKQYTITR